MTNYLGIDAGGTKIRWQVLDDVSTPVAAGEESGAQPAVVGTERAGAVLAQLIFELHDSHGPVVSVVGVAGGGSEKVRRGLADALRELGASRRVVFCGDPEIAAAATLAAGPGVAAWAGTGSFAIARDRDGKLQRVGGRGYLLGDRGSAFAIVRAAAVAAVEALDGIGPDTVLGEVLVEAFGVARVADLGATMQRMSTREVAARSVAVLAVADRDPVTSAILDREVGELAKLIREVARRTRVDRSPCVVGGGVATKAKGYADRLARALDGEVVCATRTAAEGAAVLARAIHLRESPLAHWVS